MRYALFYTPPPVHPLRQQLCRWLGRNPVTNQAVRQPDTSFISSSRLKELTRIPRRYGPHATLKAPFRLAPGKTERMLKDAIHDFCFQYSPFMLPLLIVSRMDNFFCLTMDQYSGILHNFAASCVRTFDHFRAQATSLETAQQRANILSEKERYYLRDWGYPYVLDRYCFHIPLTSHVKDPVDRQQVNRALVRFFAGALDTPLPVQGISLFVEPAPGKNFILQEHFSFCSEQQNYAVKDEKELA